MKSFKEYFITNEFDKIYQSTDLVVKENDTTSTIITLCDLAQLFANNQPLKIWK